MITIKEGNMFNDPVEGIINPVNCIGVMGAGLAKAFKLKYPGNFTAYQAECANNRMTVGKVFIYDRGKELTIHRFIINFPTKDHWVHPSEMSFISEGLSSLKEAIEHHQIKSIAVPALGCGLGHLRWAEVKKIVDLRLQDLECEVHLYPPF